MQHGNLARLSTFLASRALDGALISDPATVTWLTGYAPPIESGPSPFEGGPALAWVVDGSLTLVMSDAEAPAARDLGADVREYAGYTVETAVAAFANQAETLEALIAEAPRRGPVAIEADTLPARLLTVLQRVLPDTTLEPIDRDVAWLRAVKDADEIARIRGALALCDLAHAHLREVLRPGMTELDLWNTIRLAIEAEAGERVPALVDVVSGPRAADVGGPPSARVIEAGDPVILDPCLRRDGYWGDNAGTWFCGPPSADLARAESLARDALRRATDAVRPGVEARELDRILRDTVAGFAPGTTYPHHSGHGVGPTYHDHPRIVPYETARLEAGMVITLEPGIYLPGVGGVRVEDVVLVTDDGCELLTGHLLADPVVAI